MKIAWMCQRCPTHDNNYCVQCPVCRLLTQTILRNLFGKSIGSIELKDHSVKPFGNAVMIGRQLGWLHGDRVDKEQDIWSYKQTKRGKVEIFSGACYGNFAQNLDCACSGA